MTVAAEGLERAGIEDAARRAEEMHLLVEMGQRLNAILDLETLLRAITSEVHVALRCRLAALGLLERGRLRVAAAAGPGEPLQLPGDATIDLATGLCGWVARHREPVCVADVAGDARFYCPPSWQSLGIRSAAVVPVELGGELLGVLDAESDRPAAFDALDLALLQSIANQAAVAIGNARTYAQSEQRAAVLRALLRTTQELNSTLDLRRLLEIIAHEARSLIDVDSCIIALLNPEAGTLTPVIALHNWAEQVLGVTLKPGEGITGLVAQTGVGMIANHADQDPRAVTIPDTPDVPEALLAAPLQHKGRTIGVMTLCRLGEREFSPPDLELANSFAGQAAVAVENARLYTESGQHARQLEQAHARLLKAQDQLLQAEKLSAIGQLAAGVAHELNNPLTAIMGFAQLLEEDGLSPAGRSDVRRILAAVERAQKIVANLLTFARQQRISPQPLDLTALVERILKLHSKEFGSGRVAVRSEVEELPGVRADPFQIEQLLMHLLRNAYRAMSQAGGTLTVRLGRAGSSLLRLEVADEGPGIAADILPHIFDPFFTTGDVGQGQGLGLSACFGIVRAHQGRIWAEPRAEGGTRFVVELPLDAGAGQAPQASLDRSALVVTADEALAEVLLATLGEMGHRPTRVESAEAALAEIVVRRYDLVLCDVALPGMGIQPLFDSARANDPALGARFIALGEAGLAPAGLPAIAAPVTAERVREIVEACLGVAGSPAIGEHSAA